VLHNFLILWHDSQKKLLVASLRYSKDALTSLDREPLLRNGSINKLPLQRTHDATMKEMLERVCFVRFVPKVYKQSSDRVENEIYCCFHAVWFTTYCNPAVPVCHSANGGQARGREQSSLHGLAILNFIARLHRQLN
jgi:hypothetical protein